MYLLMVEDFFVGVVEQLFKDSPQQRKINLTLYVVIIAQDGEN
jgi:hypothetical protein